ncbi:hypothetical protein JW948_13995 [bacterium]|nr:hypothetical protein [bacterium]
MQCRFLWYVTLALVFCVWGNAQKMSVKDNNSNILMEVNDEGTVGSITLPSGSAPSTTTNKLYNDGGALSWNGSALGTGGWTDAGTVVRLTTGTDKVGIGDDSPTYSLDVAGKIGINDTQVLFLPDQAGTAYAGTFIVGNGGTSLSHGGVNESQFNTALGIDVMPALTTGYRNTVVGYQALYTATTGQDNTAVGYQALYSGTGSSYNTAVGWRALYNNTSLSNTAVGDMALLSNTTGIGNTALGHSANVSAGNLSNATAIGLGAVVNASNKVRIGNDDVTVIEGKVAWTASSDSTKKENLLAADGEEVLDKISTMWLGSWNFKGPDNLNYRHYGPMAQAFYRAFGEDGIGTCGTDTTICASDIDGINMIAIQALEKRTAEYRDRICMLEQENEFYKTEINRLNSFVTDLYEKIESQDAR